MKIDKGFRLDERPYNQVSGSWRYAKNVILTKGLQSINNEEGFDLIESIDKPIIGSIQIDNKVIIFSTNNTISEIGLLNENDVYTTIIKSIHLGFNLENPIEGEAKKNFKNETIISWISGLNTTAKPPALLNIDNLPFTLDTNKELINSSEIVKMYLTPDVKVPYLTQLKQFSGGNAPQGSIQFAIAYLISEVDITDFIYVTNTLHNESTSRNYSVTLDNLDKRYNKYRVVVINRQDTKTEVNLIGDVSTSINTFSYNGQHIASTYTLEDVLINSQSFEKVQAITSFKDELIYANYETFNIDYQCYANNIKVKWKVDEKIAGNNIVFDINSPISDTDIYNDFENRVFKPFEVYCLYITLIDLKGRESQAFHLSGRDVSPYTEETFNPFNSTANDITPLGAYSNITLIDGLLSIKIEEPTLTILIPFLNNFFSKFVYLNGNKYTPISWSYETLNGTPIALNIRLEGVYTVIPEPLTGSFAFIYDVSDNDIVPNTTTGIKKFQNNDTSNITTNSLSYWENANERYPDTSDFDVCDASGVISTLRNKKVRHHRIPTNVKINEAITTNGGGRFCIYLDDIYIPDNIKNKIQGYKVYYAKKDGNNQTVLFEGFAKRKGDAIINKPSSTGEYRVYSKEALDYKPNLSNTYIRNNEESTFNDIRVPTIFNFQPAGNGVANPDREEHITLSIPGNDILGTPVLSVERVIQDIHFKFDNQTTVATSVFHPTNLVDNNYTSLNIFDADTYNKVEKVTVHSYDLPDVSTIINATVNTFMSPAVSDTVNDGSDIIGSYISVDDLKPLSINTGLELTTNKFPFRVNRSLKDFEETSSVGWRSFLPNSYYDMPREKGEVWKLENSNKLLYIQHKYTLYTAQIKDTLKSDDITSYLGVGDIFDRQPDEIISVEEGYIGCQSKFAAFVCKLGYFVVDQNQGKVFLIKGTNASEISNKGLRNFFREELPLENEIDNPFNGIGLVANYDEKWDRLLLSKNIKRTTETENNYSFTFSYSPLIENWVALHDYIMDASFNTRNKLYSVNNNTLGQIFKHNIEGKKAIFYNQSEVNESMIDVVFNNNRTQSKIISSINWISDTLKLDNTVVLKDTLTHIMVYNNYQCSGIVALQLVPTWFNEIKDIKEEEWSFNKFSDIVIDRNLPFIDKKYNVIITNVTNNKSWFNKNKFIGKFVIVRFIYDNVSQNDFYLNDVNVNKRISDR